MGESSGPSGGTGPGATDPNGAESADDTAGGDDGSNDGGADIEPCGAFVPGNDFQVCTATYLAGPGDDQAGSVAIANDGSVIWVGSIMGDELDQTPQTLLGGGTGAVVRLSADGRTVSSLSRIGAHVEDVDVMRSDGTLVVVGDFGVAALSPDATQVVWSHVVGGTVTRVAASSEHVAVLSGTTVTLFDHGGTKVVDVPVGTTRVSDIALDGSSQSIFATGFKQDDGPPCTQLQIPFVRSYGFDGQLKWANYDWNRTEVGAASECADSRGEALAIGGDGKLYYAGESHGGNTVHRRMPRDLDTFAPNVKFDAYNDGYNLNAAAPITYYARFDAATGEIEVGQFLLTRLNSNDKGNAARPHAIAADVEGNVYVAGGTACCIERGAEKTVNGEPAMSEAYQGGGFLLVVSSNFEQRLAWTTMRGIEGGGEVGTRLATYGGNVAATFRQTADEDTTDGPLLTFDAVRPSPGGGKSDGYLVVWPRP